MFLCAPALIYLVFSVTQIIIDTFKGLYNTAFFKFVVMIMVTLLLNALCQQGLGIISWFIVFIPFIFMTFIVSILLYVFGLNPATGKINVTCPESSNTDEDDDENTNTSILGQIDKSGNIIFINPASTSTSTSSSASTSTATTVTTSPNFYVPPTADEVNSYNYTMQSSSSPVYESFTQ
jgi:hypothetical protein